MFLYGLAGFIIGIIIGGVLNRFLLRNVPVDQWRTNRKIKLTYGALNWVIGLVGLGIGLYLAQSQ